MDTWTMGTTIARLRKEKGLTQEALANRLGVSNQAVSKWESDQCCPDVLLLPKLADEFAISIDMLFGRVQPETPEQATLPVIAELPWEDNDDLHAVCFVGHRLVGHEKVNRSEGRRGGLLNLFVNSSAKTPEAATVALRFSGTVRDIYSDFSVSCSGVNGNVTAGDGVCCGAVGGNVTAGDGVECTTVGGDVKASDGVNCEQVGGNVTAGDSVHCADVYGSVAAGDSVTCGNIGGNAKARALIRCTGIGGTMRQG